MLALLIIPILTTAITGVLAAVNLVGETSAVVILSICVMGEASAIAWTIKWKRDSDKDRDENYISKAAYNDLKNVCDVSQTKCSTCPVAVAFGESLIKQHEALGEISANGMLLAQMMAAIRQTIDNALLRGGN